MHQRSFSISRSQSGQKLAAVVRQELHCSWSVARRLIHEGKVRLDGKHCTDSARVLRPGQRLELPARPLAAANERKMTGNQSRPEKNKKRHVVADKSLARPILRFADDHIIVVDKPAGLTTVRHAEDREEFGKRARRFLPATLADLLPDLVGGKQSNRIRAVHRLDKETSGLLVFARTAQAESHLGRQMRAHSSGRKYLALVRGQPKSERIESDLILDRGDGRRGSATKPGEGKRAVTHVKVLEQFIGFALVECELETGRTHQVRIHLGERETPLCGDHIYDRPLHGRPLPDTSGANRPMLHAGYLEIEHPATGKRLSWAAPLPADMKDLLKKLRRRERKDGE